MTVAGKSNGNRRSPKWSAARDAFLKLHPACEVCDGKKGLVAHHIVPFFMDRSKELDPNNLVALCEENPTINCHLWAGHGGNFADYNPHVKKTIRFMHWLKTCKQRAVVK